MNDDRRRYFRISDSIGIVYHRLQSGSSRANPAQEHEPLERKPNLLDLMAEQDVRLEQLLREVETESPKVAELVNLFNQKLERVVNQLLVESDLLARIAFKAKEVSISACGLAFHNREPIDVGAVLSFELTLLPTETPVVTNGRIVGCDYDSETGRYFWRVDFFAMSHSDQELLIQHIVRAQVGQLKSLRDT